jgi:hypothetical protein
MAYGDYADCAAQAQNAQMAGGGIAAGDPMRNATLAKQQPMRERVQVAHKRATGIVAMLANLTNAVILPSVLSGDGQSIDQVKDSTLSGDIDELARAINTIESQVAKLSIAITGAP